MTYKRYQGITFNEEKRKERPVDLKPGDDLVLVADVFISLEDAMGEVVCYKNSQVHYEHFAYNGDGDGRERGELIWAIAFAPRENTKGARFTDVEQLRLRIKWKHMLQNWQDAILFNEDFYKAPVSTLKEMASDLSIKKVGREYRHVHYTK